MLHNASGFTVYMQGSDTEQNARKTNQMELIEPCVVARQILRIRPSTQAVTLDKRVRTKRAIVQVSGVQLAMKSR